MKTQTFTINVPKADSTVSVDVTKWPAESIAHVFAYGLTQLGNDAHSQIGLVEGKANFVADANTDAVLKCVTDKFAALAKGEFRTGGGGKRRDELLVESIAIVANRTRVTVSRVAKDIKCWADMETVCNDLAKAAGKAGKGDVVLVNLRKAAQNNIDARSGDFI